MKSWKRANIKSEQTEIYTEKNLEMCTVGIAMTA